MANYEILCDVAFGTDPGAAPTWTDVSAYVLEFSSRRGRNMELDRMETGTLSLKLDNRTRRFEPLYASSPYYPNVIPMRRVRVRVRRPPTTGTVYNVFYGFVEEWPQSYEGVGTFGQVDVKAVDSFEVLNNVVFASSGTRGQELSGARVNYVLDQIGWPAGDRSVDTGNSQIQAYDFDSFNALQHLQDVADTENGVLFADAQGRVVFQNRQRRLSPPYNSLVGTFGDGASEFPYGSVTLNFSKDQIRNDVRVTYANDTGSPPTEVVASDSSSQTRYLKRSFTKQPWLPIGSAEAPDYAGWLLGRFKEPSLRIDSVSLEPSSDQAVWDVVLAREISDKVRVNRRPTGGTAITQDSHIEAVSIAGNRDVLRVNWALSPADVQTYWVLGTAGYSELDTTTRLGY